MWQFVPFTTGVAARRGGQVDRRDLDVHGRGALVCLHVDARNPSSHGEVRGFQMGGVTN